MEPALIAVCFVLGLVFGSFANVAIHRVPEGESVVRPPSACPECGQPIRPRDNVPVVSWLFLRGRCRDCGAPISARYPLVELVSGVLFAVTAWRLVMPSQTAEPDPWALPAYFALVVSEAPLRLDAGKVPAQVLGGHERGRDGLAVARREGCPGGLCHRTAECVRDARARGPAAP
jgi:leader peptidase (prepilin peptidase)/N-methyltransferase